MSDMCLQCNTKAGSIDYSDLTGIGPGQQVVCDGCGLVEVGWQGQCLGCPQHDMMWSPEAEEEKPSLELIRGGLYDDSH